MAETGMQSLNRPLRIEAMEYCDRLGIDSCEELERVRISMCYQEFRRRMDPWYRRLAKHFVFQVMTDRSPAALELEATLNEIAIKELQDLGLHYSPLPWAQTQGEKNGTQKG